ncbi:MAG: Lrp/AsnC family transcriptional regulator [Thermoprotei archaeon]
MNIDEIDMKILKILSKNARTPYNEIAREVGLSDVAIIKRVKKLEKRGIIKRYTILVDPAKLGYTKVSITGVNVGPDALLKVVEELKKREYVKFIAVTSGDHPIITVIWARDSEELTRIHKELESIPGVTKVYPAIILDTVKEYEVP